jgi:hypothetical protein
MTCLFLRQELRPKTPVASLRGGLDGVIDVLLSAQHVLEMFRRALPNGTSRSSLARLSNRLAKILVEVRKLPSPCALQKI